MKVSWLPQHIIETGRVGLTHSPGAFDASRDDDLSDLADAGVDRVVCLQQEFEFSYTGPGNESIENRSRAVEALGIRFTHFPIPDFGTPDLDSTSRLVEKILADLSKDRSVILHCFAGLGRAGTIAASVLTAKGIAADDAITHVRNVRPGAIQTREQELFVIQFEAEQTHQFR